MSIKVSVVEDHEPFRTHLALLIGGSASFSCVGAHGHAEAALQNVALEAPDVILLDLELPGMQGLELIAKLKEKQPSAEIMILTIHDDSRMIFRALQSGASGYLVKPVPPADLLEAIEEVHRGGSPMSSQIARLVVKAFQKPARQSPLLETLSKREHEVLDQLAKGYLYKEIANTSGISIDTVRSHIRRIYGKLHVRSRTEAVLKTFPQEPGRQPE